MFTSGTYMSISKSRQCGNHHWSYRIHRPHMLPKDQQPQPQQQQQQQQQPQPQQQQQQQQTQQQEQQQQHHASTPSGLDGVTRSKSVDLL